MLSYFDFLAPDGQVQKTLITLGRQGLAMMLFNDLFPTAKGLLTVL